MSKNGKKLYDYETYLSEKQVFSMELIFERTINYYRKEVKNRVWEKKLQPYI